MDYGEVLSAAGQSGSGEMEIIATGTSTTSSGRSFSQAVKASTPWVSFDLTKLDEITGIDVSSLKLGEPG